MMYAAESIDLAQKLFLRKKFWTFFHKIFKGELLVMFWLTLIFSFKFFPNFAITSNILLKLSGCFWSLWALMYFMYNIYPSYPSLSFSFLLVYLLAFSSSQQLKNVENKVCYYSLVCAQCIRWTGHRGCFQTLYNTFVPESSYPNSCLVLR